MKRILVLSLWLCCAGPAHSWGFFGHRKINYYAVFLLPPEMLVLYKTHISFLTEHAVDPDKRRYIVPVEGARHYIDLDRYGRYPFDSLPHKWNLAVAKYPADTLARHGIVPWWIPVMTARLTNAFREKELFKILKLSAELGHYIADAHVPLHTTRNHNGQLTDQKGIHGFWESRLPELLAEKEWDFFIQKAVYIRNPSEFIWKRVLESAAAADTVLQTEKSLSLSFPPDQKFAFEERGGTAVRQYSEAYSIRYNQLLRGMVERRMRQAIFAVASFWYTAWVNAGQPDLRGLANRAFTAEEQKELELLNQAWRNAGEPEEHL